MKKKESKNVYTHPVRPGVPITMKRKPMKSKESKKGVGHAQKFTRTDDFAALDTENHPAVSPSDGTGTTQ